MGIERTLTSLLDETHSRLLDPHPDASTIVAELSRGLRDLKRTQTPMAWEATIEVCRQHAVRLLLHEDPLTERAYRKPRGYQGDAELLDIIYQRRGGRNICHASRRSDLRIHH